MSHRLADSWPQPSGWRASCSCGWEGRGITEWDALSEFLAHAEQVHGTITEDTD